MVRCGRWTAAAHWPVSLAESPNSQARPLVFKWRKPEASRSNYGDSQSQYALLFHFFMQLMEFQKFLKNDFFKKKMM